MPRPESNTHADFVGVPQLIARHRQQIDDFEEWAAVRWWIAFHHSHYDWWAFPISRPSSYGYRYTVYGTEVKALLEDEAFVAAYLQGLALVSESWGWDLDHARHISPVDNEQCWSNWPIRLSKMARSARLFGFEQEFQSLCAYGRWLIAQGHDMRYNGRDTGKLYLLR